MIGCMAIGLISDCLIARGFRMIVMEDIHSFSLTVLQIQAGLGTLTLSIIALITGNISDSNLGISISDYYLNIRPKWLKQKRIIYISLAFILVGMICFILGLHNTVFFAFVGTLIAVLISIAEMYSIFKGKSETNKEIEEYINDVLEREENIEEQRSLCHKFIDDWKQEIISQDKESYEQCLTILKKYMKTLYEAGTDDGLKYIQQQYYRILYCFLSSEKRTSKERGIVFIQDIYDWLWGEILKNPDVALEHQDGFSLLSDVSRELNDAIDDLEAEKIEKILRFYSFFDSVHRINTWLGEGKRDLSELFFFARKIGYYLSKQKDKGNLIVYGFWLKPFERMFLLSTYNIPENRCEAYLNEKWSIYFNYCYGMLMHGMEDIVKQGLYCKSLNNLYRLEYKQEVLLYLSVHCYVYYLAERESNNCIEDSVRTSARNLLYNEDVKKMFHHFLYMLSEKDNLLNPDMPEEIYRFLDRYELFPKFSSAKTMIMNNVVRDFYLFMILYIENEFYAPNLLERNIDGEIANTYLGEGAEQRIKKIFEQLYKIIHVEANADVESYNETIELRTALLYENLRKTAVQKQKEQYIKIAKEEQKRYDSTVDRESVCRELAKKVTEKLKEKFYPILSEEIAGQMIEIPVLRLETYTSLFDEKCIDGFYSHINGMFLQGIVESLKRMNVLEWKKRYYGISGDKEYLGYLKANDFKILAGSEFMLKSRSYQMSEKIRDYLEQYETIYTSGISEGLALKEHALGVCLHDIQVSVKSPTIEESSARYDAMEKKYKYAIVNDIPLDFEEDELRKYLYNHRKKVTVTARVFIQINKEPVGTVFEKEKN